jgi:thiamine transport system substrate-binding protein
MGPFPPVHARARTAAAAVVLALTAAGCSLTTGDGGGDDAPDADGNPTQVTLLVHDSFQLPDELLAQFEEDSGYELEVRPLGDAGRMTNQLVLTKDEPLGDVAFGIDNTFGSRAVEAGVFAPYEGEVPAGADAYDLAGDDEHVLTPVDNGGVCVNVDETWFEERGQEPPETLDDLTDPEYADLLVTPSPVSSSPGLAFLLATIGAEGDDWPDYWRDLLANGAKVTTDWENAYNVDFTQGGGSGQRPVVVSYDSSPAFTVGDDGESTTRALLDTCFQQVEYAGVLEGAANPDGAEQLVDFLVSPPVQEALPESMYVFPVADGVALPPDWERHTERPTAPIEVDPAEIDANRDQWLQEWSDLTTR